MEMWLAAEGVRVLKCNGSSIGAYIHQMPKPGKLRESCNRSLVQVRNFSPERPSTGPSVAFACLSLF